MDVILEAFAEIVVYAIYLGFAALPMPTIRVKANTQLVMNLGSPLTPTGDEC
jgi:hypothetical protein